MGMKKVRVDDKVPDRSSGSTCQILQMNLALGSFTAPVSVCRRLAD
jgi:hypothetical protein